jgi:carboxyl-terminal processing protease
MDVPPQEPRTAPSTERIARGAVFVFLILAIVTLAFGLGFGVNELRSDSSSTSTVTGSGNQNASGDTIGAAILTEIYEILKAQYVDRDFIDPATFREAAIQGVLNSLNDPHTQYLTPEQIRAGALDLSSSYQGIGASVTDRNGVVEIIAPFRDSPAERAGIRAGDIILEVDGERTDGWSDQEAVQRIRGPRGTEVTLKVQHTDGTVETITIVRGEIQIESVFTEPRLEVIPGESGDRLVDAQGNDVRDIIYVNIAQFHDKTVSELREKLRGIDLSRYRGMILDLRSNPGGLLSATVEVTDEFLDSGRILSERDAQGKESTWDARSGGIATRIPIVILQDAGSASGAEVLAAALKDNGRAVIVGQRSFGKGTVNQLYTLRNCGDPNGCGGLYLSVGRWYRPNGSEIEGLGIVPDFEVAMTSDDYIENGDLQLFKAIEILRSR